MQALSRIRQIDYAVIFVKLISPLTDHPWGHRTIFFRDPDGNVLEVFAEI